MDSRASGRLTGEQILNRPVDEMQSCVIEMDDMMDIPFLSLKGRNELYARSEMIFGYYNKRQVTLIHFNQQIAAYNFSRHGFGVTFVSDTFIRADPSDRLRYYLFSCPTSERWISIGYKKDKYMTRAKSSFIETAEEVVGN